MLYTILKIGNKEYKCRLTARACVDLERVLEGNPLNIFVKMEQTKQLPKLEDLIYILHASLQAYEHGISLNDAYDIYDAFVDNGKTIEDLVFFMYEIFRVSGFFNQEVEVAKESIEKNQLAEN